MIVINLDKAKTIAHNKRREARNKEFFPLDEIISKQIPGKDLQQVELERKKIREKYAEIQVKMDSAKTINELKLLLPE